MNLAETRKRAPRRLARAVLIAAAVLAALTVTAVAAFDSGILPGWFGTRWQRSTGQELSETQQAIIDSLTETIGESQTSNGVTVTVDSITADDNALWAYLVVEGFDFDPEESYFFSRWSMTVDPLEEDAGGYGSQADMWVRDGALHVGICYSSDAEESTHFTDGAHTLTLSLTDLVRYDSPFEYPIIQTGQWDFSIPLSETCASPVRTIESADVLVSVSGSGLGDAFQLFLARFSDPVPLPDSHPEPGLYSCTVTNVQLTGTSIRFHTSSGSIPFVSAVLRNGTEVECGCSGGQGRWHGVWPAPLDVEDIAAIRFGETEVPLS